MELSRLNSVLVVVNVAVLSVLSKLVGSKNRRLLNKRGVSVDFVSVSHKIRAFTCNSIYWFILTHVT